jgi:hypothetical protein
MCFSSTAITHNQAVSSTRNTTAQRLRTRFLCNIVARHHTSIAVPHCPEYDSWSNVTLVFKRVEVMDLLAFLLYIAAVEAHFASHKHTEYTTEYICAMRKNSNYFVNPQYKSQAENIQQCEKGATNTQAYTKILKKAECSNPHKMSGSPGREGRWIRPAPAGEDRT